MRSLLWPCGLIVLCLAGGFWATALSWPQDENPIPVSPAPEKAEELPYDRIVSMSPSVTEILFALDLGDRVVGVTEFCDYPPAAQERPTIGGYFNPNYEALVALEPDLVVLLEEHEDPRRYLSAFELDVLTVNHQKIDGILESIPLIGKACGRETRARAMVEKMQGTIDAIRSRTRDLPRPSVLVSVGRTLGTGSIQELYIAGRDGFYDLMIEWAGGRNAYQGAPLKYPLVSSEGLLSMNPDVIIDLSTETETSEMKTEEVRKEWNSLPRLSAVRAGRVHIFGEDYVGIPGPRFVLTLQRIARSLHPELEWDDL